MIKSMTGFGRGEAGSDNVKVAMEVKSVNHRYCEVVLRMPRSMNVLEDRIRKFIQSKIARGRVDVFVNIELSGENRPRVTIEEELAGDYLRAAQEVKTRLRLGGGITLNELLHLPGVVSLEEPEKDAALWWPVVENALDVSLAGLLEMRAQEGKRLQRDIRGRARHIAAMVGEIEARAPVVVEEYRERLSQRISELLEPGVMDQSRLDAEVVLHAERSGIVEEIVRLYSHLEQLDGALDSETTVGRKLDFLMQEMNREVNTIASKSADLAINRTVVEIKSELEKIREQVQNIE